MRIVAGTAGTPEEPPKKNTLKINILFASQWGAWGTVRHNSHVWSIACVLAHYSMSVRGPQEFDNNPSISSLSKFRGHKKCHASNLGHTDNIFRLQVQTCKAWKCILSPEIHWLKLNQKEGKEYWRIFILMRIFRQGCCVYIHIIFSDLNIRMGHSVWFSYFIHCAFTII